MKRQKVTVRTGVKRAAGSRDRKVLKLLIVLDVGETSKRVLQYVVHVLGGRDRVEFNLAYISPRMPPQFLESGGSELPEREVKIESDLRAQQNEWMAISDARPDRILSRARSALLKAGVRADRIHSAISSPLDARTAADEVLVLARDQQCRTIVVGHRAHSWFRRMARSDLAEQLVRSAEKYAVWVID
jgi:nucleotide-binding universal stress UspA family protein